ncbi:MAG: NAD(P)-dependent dehydrogenase (short-subunit alcohol dehydrogenase family) [Verrucomicrobiales bacterium]|jgi:NAD(P)-dependent dehydrogenase (short-subunit alcohol dehydrogenase family)
MRPIMLITGGSRGIGAACAVQAAEAGYDVCFSYASNSEAAALVRAQCESHGARALAVKADVSAENDVLSLFETCDAEMGTLSVLVNNAGVIGTQGELADFTAERIRWVVDVNVTGALLCMREATLRMSTKRGGAGGAIINLSSMASTLGAPFEYIDYAATKGAIDAATIGLSKELGPAGVRVNAVRPGPIHTDIHASGGEPDRIARVSANIPMGRGGEPAEVANLILWLASDEASYVRGDLVEVSGGR